MSRYCVIGVSLMALLLAACSEIHLATIPPTPPTAKVRVYVEAVSTKQSTKGKWGTSLEDFADKQSRSIERILRQSGIYEVVSDDEVEAVLGEQQPTRWELERDHWALARRIAGALHADYTLIVERGIGSSGPQNRFLEIVLINAVTGKRFGVSFLSYSRAPGEGAWPRGTPQALYRELFKDAKGDLLNTAIRKSLLLTPVPPVATPTILLGNDTEKAAIKPAPAGTTQEKARALKEQADREQAERERTLALKKKTERERAEQEKARALKTAPPSVTETGSRIINFDDMDSGLFETGPTGKGERLVVYDLEAAENLRPTALILSESLREELFKFGRFTLVNRENLLQLLGEMKFQQSGLVDEKQAVQLGKGMAANQVITGRFGPLGASYVLQAKRIDVQSFGTRALGSLKCRQGEEEQLLDQLPDLAKKLAEAP